MAHAGRLQARVFLEATSPRFSKEERLKAASPRKSARENAGQPDQSYFALPKRLAAGWTHGLSISSRGHLHSWGEAGTTGHGDREERYLPERLELEPDKEENRVAKEVAAGRDFSMALGAKFDPTLTLHPNRCALLLCRRGGRPFYFWDQSLHLWPTTGSIGCTTFAHVTGRGRGCHHGARCRVVSAGRKGGEGSGLLILLP